QWYIQNTLLFGHDGDTKPEAGPEGVFCERQIEGEAASQNEQRVGVGGGGKANGERGEGEGQGGKKRRALAPPVACRTSHNRDRGRAKGNVQPARTGLADTKQPESSSQAPKENRWLVGPDGQEQWVNMPEMKRPKAVDRLIFPKRETIEQENSETKA